MEVLDDAGRKQVDEQLSTWRQSDCVIGELWFLFRTNTERPLTRDAVAAVIEGAENAETAVHRERDPHEGRTQDRHEPDPSRRDLDERVPPVIDRQ